MFNVTFLFKSDRKLEKLSPVTVTTSQETLSSHFKICFCAGSLFYSRIISFPETAVLLASTKAANVISSWSLERLSLADVKRTRVAGTMLAPDMSGLMSNPSHIPAHSPRPNHHPQARLKDSQDQPVVFHNNSLPPFTIHLSEWTNLFTFRDGDFVRAELTGARRLKKPCEPRSLSSPCFWKEKKNWQVLLKKRPFLSCYEPHYETEASCIVFVWTWFSFICKQTIFHMKIFAHCLALVTSFEHFQSWLFCKCIMLKKRPELENAVIFLTLTLRRVFISDNCGSSLRAWKTTNTKINNIIQWSVISCRSQ